MAYQNIEDSRMYRRAEKIADTIWHVVIKWEPFAKETVGKQLVRAADSIGANIAESAGRFTPGDAIHFIHYARGSLRKTRYYLKRARERHLISSDLADQLTSELSTLAAELNAYINYQRARKLKEPSAEYNTATSDK